MAYSLRYGGKKNKKHSFKIATDMLAIRYDEPRSFERLVRSTQSRPEVSALQEVCRFAEANVTVMKERTGGHDI